MSGPNSLETGNNEKGNEGNGDKLFRSEDDVFSDAVADFSDSGSNPEIKERLQDSLDSGADVERVDIKEPKFSGSSEDKDFNGVKICFNVICFYIIYPFIKFPWFYQISVK